jgi:hypothetical protein
MSRAASVLDDQILKFCHGYCADHHIKVFSLGGDKKR